MRLLPTMMLPLLLIGCAAVPQEPEGAELARELQGRIAGPARQCISASSQTRSLTPVDRRTLVYRDGRTIWVNRLSDGCPGFRPLDTLIVEVHSGQYCRNDRARAIPPGGGIPGPTCLLGDFVPYRL